MRPGTKLGRNDEIRRYWDSVDRPCRIRRNFRRKQVDARVGQSIDPAQRHRLSVDHKLLVPVDAPQIFGKFWIVHKRITVALQALSALVFRNFVNRRWIRPVPVEQQRYRIVRKPRIGISVHHHIRTLSPCRHMVDNSHIHESPCQLTAQCRRRAVSLGLHSVKHRQPCAPQTVAVCRFPDTFHRCKVTAVASHVATQRHYVVDVTAHSRPVDLPRI